MKNTLENIRNDRLPINLNEALIKFGKNNFMKNCLGEKIHQHYFSFFNFEYTDFMTQVDEWELNRYLYNI